MDIYVKQVVKEKNRIKGYVCVNRKTGEEKLLTKEQLVEIIKQHRCSNAKAEFYKNNWIIRIKNDTVSCNVCKHTELADRLRKTEKGTPLKIKLNLSSEYKQVIYLGELEVQYSKAFLFFDGCGLQGILPLTEAYIVKQRTTAIFDDNDPVKVAELRNLLK